MGETCSEKFQYRNVGDGEYILTMDKERVYGIHRIAPDHFLESWRVSPETEKKPSLMQKISEQLNRPLSFDISIHIGDFVQNCFIMVLQSYSKFFRKASRHEKVIGLDSSRITPEVFQKIYAWMLDSSKRVQREGLVDVLIGAQYLEVDFLVLQIWNLVQDGAKFQECEAFLLYLEAKQSNHDKIQNMMINRVQQFFMIVVCSEEFLLMDSIEISDWLKLDSIAVNSEVDVFYSACRWLLHDWNERKIYLVELMKHVRFGLIEPYRICELRMNKNMCKLKPILENSELQKMLEVGLSYATYWNSFPDDQSKHFQDFLRRFELKRLFNRELLDYQWQIKYEGATYTYEGFEECIKEFSSKAFALWNNKSKSSQNKT